jgi:hypothetical protein
VGAGIFEADPLFLSAIYLCSRCRYLDNVMFTLEPTQLIEIVANGWRA